MFWRVLLLATFAKLAVPVQRDSSACGDCLSVHSRPKCSNSVVAECVCSTLPECCSSQSTWTLKCTEVARSCPCRSTERRHVELEQAITLTHPWTGLYELPDGCITTPPFPGGCGCDSNCDGCTTIVELTPANSGQANVYGLYSEVWWNSPHGPDGPYLIVVASVAEESGYILSIRNGLGWQLHKVGDTMEFLIFYDLFNITGLCNSTLPLVDDLSYYFSVDSDSAAGGSNEQSQLSEVAQAKFGSPVDVPSTGVGIDVDVLSSVMSPQTNTPPPPTPPPPSPTPPTPPTPPTSPTPTLFNKFASPDISKFNEVAKTQEITEVTESDTAIETIPEIGNDELVCSLTDRTAGITMLNVACGHSSIDSLREAGELCCKCDECRSVVLLNNGTYSARIGPKMLEHANNALYRRMPLPSAQTNDFSEMDSSDIDGVVSEGSTELDLYQRTDMAPSFQLIDYFNDFPQACIQPHEQCNHSITFDICARSCMNEPLCLSFDHSDYLLLCCLKLETIISAAARFENPCSTGIWSHYEVILRS